MRERIKKIWKLLIEELALFSLEFILVLILGLSAMAVFIKLSLMLLNDNVEVFDQKMYHAVRGFASASFDTFMRSVTFIGNLQFAVYPIAAIFIYFLFIKPHRWYSIKIPVVAAGSITANILLKNLFHRPRPTVEHMVYATGESYPSGHAMCSAAFYGLLIYILWHSGAVNKTFRVIATVFLVCLIICIGASRVYLGVHYASDVMAGFSVGLIWLLVSIVTVKRIEKFVSKRATPEQAPVLEPAAVLAPDSHKGT